MGKSREGELSVYKTSRVAARPEKHSRPRVSALSFSLPDHSEWGQIMERALLEESGDLRFMQMERIGELDCCIFEAGDAWDAQKQEFAYYPSFPAQSISIEPDR
jgi:hypothetical protein